jgi:hypothetical protein
MRVELEDNMAKKTAILNRAEALKDATQWNDTTAEMNELMTEWKSIGPVPREHSQSMWEQFLAARRHFFDRKDAAREKRKHHQERQKNERVSRAKHFVHQLEDEIKEHEEELADFTNGLENITPGKKAEELRQHLENLIKEVSAKLDKKRKKLEDALKQSAPATKERKEKNTVPAATQEKEGTEEEDMGAEI